MRAILQIYRKKYSPPGMDVSSEKNIFIAGNVLAFLYALMVFFFSYANALNDLYEYEGVKRVLIEGRKILDFSLVFQTGMMGFLLTAAVMLIFIIFRYTCYVQGSKSIYLMKRLPKKFEIHKRALISPLTEAVISILLGILTTLLFFGLYILLTPKAALPHGLWEDLLNFFF